MRAEITGFFDEPTFTVSYVVADPRSRRCAVIDSLLDFDAASGRTAHRSADRIIDHISAHGLVPQWILETHVHADHLSAADYLKKKLAASTGIGDRTGIVQRNFAKVFNEAADFATDGRQFDKLFADNEVFSIGEIEARVIHTPGHTPACVTYVIGDAAFVGDTLFMPDYGTARCDFPGGDAVELYRSIRRIYQLPPETRLFLCHDYKAPGRNTFEWETTVAAQRAGNIHLRDGISEAEFVAMRKARDKTLDMPKLILPAVQVNMRAGEFPVPEANGIRYLKLPIDGF
jgi:glyoxylase-like metal-dependent hydrolase (beta-lactamase superfamily II)